MTSLAIAIVWCILQVTLLCVAGGLSYLLVRRWEPRLGRTSIAILLGLVTLLSLGALSPWPSWRDFAGSRPADAATDQATSGAHLLSPSAREVPPDQRTLTAASEPHAAFLSTPFWTAVWDELNRPMARAASSPAMDAPSLPGWASYVMLLTALAACLGGIRLAVACYALRRLQGNSRPLAEPRVQWLVQGLQRSLRIEHSVEVRETARLGSAATIGWRRPVVLLPAEWRTWPQEELHAVLAHELAHVAARDWPMWLVAQLAVALHFYHPLVHWLAHRLRLEQELAADAAAAKMTGSKESYLGNLAAQMLRTEEGRPMWAAQTFLPTRSTIVRRIEMLKSKSPLPSAGRPNGHARFIAVTALLAIGVVVAGIRMPSGDMTPTGMAQQPSGDRADRADLANPDPVERINADAKTYALYAEPNAPFLAYMRPREIFASDEMSPLKAQINQLISESKEEFAHLKVEELEAFGVSPYLNPDRHESVRVVLTFAEPIAAAQLRSIRTKYLEVERIGGNQLYSSSGEPSGKAALQVGEHTLILDSSFDRLKLLATRLATSGNAPHEWVQKAIPPSDAPHVWVALNMDFTRVEFARAQRGDGGGPVPLAAISPLVEKPRSAFAVGNFAPDLELSVVAVCESEQDAQQVTHTAQALVTLVRNMLAEQRSASPPEGAPKAMIAGTIEMADRFLQQAEVETVGNEAHLKIAAGSLSQQLVQMGFVLPAIQSARHAAQRTQSMNNLKQLALAVHNYNAVHGHFPPAVVTGPDGKTKHSWRVAILPFLDQSALYDEYRLTEPWDSEHNKRVLESMPAVFRSPTEPGGRSHSAYYVLVGNGTVFEPEGEGTPIGEIRDGTSKTFLMVEAKRPIPWTKPEDISYSADQPLPAFGGHFGDFFLAAFADGSVQVISQDVDPTMLRRMIEKADGQPIQR